MNLQMDLTVGLNQNKRNHIARVRTEHWAIRELFCVACSSDALMPFPANKQASDFFCPKCQAEYQLKSASKWNTNKILDAGYDAMMRKIQKDETPHLLVLHYSVASWQVQNLLLVPSFFFTASSVEKRKPLSLTARRPGYVGCNILLSAIAEDGKLPVVEEGVALSATDVRTHYQKVSPLATIDVKLRGWALDVFACIQKLHKKEFTLAEVYQFESALSALHPENNNVQAKIRQQLQVLRDADLLEFTARGQYRLKI